MPKKKNSKSALKKRAKKNKSKQSKQQSQRGQSSKRNSKKPNPKNGAPLQLSDLFHSEKEFNRDITIHKLTVEPINGGADLIEECELKLTHGHRYGLIGYNGAGKSTLLKKLASGAYRKEIPSYLSVVYTHQELAGNDLTVIQTVLKSDKKREFLLAKESELKSEMNAFAESENNNKNNQRTFEDIVLELEEVVSKLKFIESDTAESRVSSLLNGLQFSESMKQMKTRDLSGGWRMRVSLASSLFIEPDLLLLDEPTNHLDFPSVLWLTEYLQFVYGAEKTIVVVSHDRTFLNHVCTNIIQLERRKLAFYTGNYDAFCKIRNDARVHQRKQFEKQQLMIAHNKEFIAKFAANKKWSTQAQSRQKMLDKLELIERVHNDLTFAFEFPTPPPLRNPSIFRFDNVSFGYFGEENPHTFILRKINLRFNYGTKAGILGANGAGKSTLISLIMNKVRPLLGTANLTNAVQIGYFSQHHTANLDMSATPLEQLRREFGSANVTTQQLYAQLGRFGLGKEIVEREIATLSGGQKSRVTFAILTWWKPHLIIMDEPTNHLDMPTIDGLANALKAFEGSILVVSHDQHFVETCCDEFWCVGQRSIKIFDDFQKCISFSKKCKAPNSLPRDYGTKNGNGTAKDTECKTEAIIKTNINKKVSSVFEIDCEREINKGLSKGLTPNGILRHCKGWKCHDGKGTNVVNKLGFTMFEKYFELTESAETEMSDIHSFFEEWKDLIRYCVPATHTLNQTHLFDIGVKTFVTALKDSHCSAVKSYGFGFICESIVARHQMIAFDVITQWLAEMDTQSKETLVVAAQIKTFIEMTLADAEGSDDSDSDSDY